MTLLRVHLPLAVGLLLAFPASAWAQNVVATIPAGTAPEAVAVNQVTNKIYVANFLSRNVAVIDGTTNSTNTVSAGTRPIAVAVNEVTNKIYVANMGFGGPFGNGDPGSVTVIDGTTNSVTTIIDPNANGPERLAVDSVTNKIYVPNFWSGNVTVIDGATNTTTTVTDPNANGLTAYAIALNPVTNKIYVLNNKLGGFGNNPGNVTVIDGATNSTVTVTDPNAILPIALAVNQATNKIYVANEGAYPAANHGNVTVIDGATNSTTTVTDPNALAPFAVAVDAVTNKIYVANLNDSVLSENGGVTIIDGATNAFVPVKDPNAIAPSALAVDSTTNTIFVANEGSFAFSGTNPGCITVIDGSTNSFTTLIDPNANAPGALAVNPLTARAYAANIGSNNVTVVSEAVNLPPGFSLSSASASLTVPPGGQKSDTITIAPQNGPFATAVQLSCTVAGSAPVPTCGLSPASVTPGANSVTSSLTITAPAGAATLLPSSHGRLLNSLDAVGIPLMFAITLVGGSKKQRRWYRALAALLVLFALLPTGCGGNSGGGTPGPLNFTVTVTGISGTIQRTTQVMVTVQ